MDAIFWPSAMRVRRHASSVSALASAGMGADKSCSAACRASWAFSPEAAPWLMTSTSVIALLPLSAREEGRR